MTDTKPSDADLLAEACENIERYRKSDLKVTVTDLDGRPAAGVNVSVHMRRHHFLCSGPGSSWA